jgi:hypothetical protein
MTADRDRDIEPAKPAARRAAIASVAVAAVAGAPLVYFTRRYLAELTTIAERDPAAALAGFRTWVLPQVLVMALVGLSAGMWLAATGLRARRTGRFPQPGAWVLQDTPIRHGASAERIGTVLIAFGTVTAIVPLMLLVVLAAIALR